MIIQTVNIVSGFLLAAPQLKTFTKSDQLIGSINSAESALAKWSKLLGVMELILGVIALVERVSYSSIVPYYYNYGSSYPQAIIAILMGLLLASHLFEKNQFVREKITLLRPYSAVIGIVGILIGLFSII
ncbi:MAG: hypothetical protein RJA61_379 [Candidatus Parcubacteria bacterium]|jgi:uncharacterized membrane protein